MSRYNHNDTKTTRILRISEVINRLGISRSGLYERIKNGDLPKPINLGGRRVGFIEHEIDTWVQQRIEKSRTL
ncbi:helix-turn-helix transcriptional regulator [Micavibrio aeruginosavorus]|uniref:AlpA family phage regulatory protein n=1 Tax=Micavibrio aeruginosavorus EPB TaxID=349215 RepID=M4VF20_9BACT|nr:hypothetical protein A11S_1003 [Micavibrio aeruginosavorus EPB]